MFVNTSSKNMFHSRVTPPPSRQPAKSFFRNQPVRLPVTRMLRSANAGESASYACTTPCQPTSLASISECRCNSRFSIRNWGWHRMPPTHPPPPGQLMHRTPPPSAHTIFRVISPVAIAPRAGSGESACTLALRVRSVWGPSTRNE